MVPGRLKRHRPQPVLATHMSGKNHQFAFTLNDLAANPNDAKLQLRFALGLYEISDLKTLLTTVLDAILTITAMERGFVLLSDQERLTFPVARDREKQKIDPEEFSYSQTIVNQVLQHGKVHYARQTNAEHLSDSARVLQLKTALCLPLVVRGGTSAQQEKILGVIYADSRRLLSKYTGEQLELFGILAGHAAMAIENARLYQMATIDALTGLYLRHYALNQLKLEWSRARRQGQPLSIVMLDIDHFKDVNDSHGHDVGDEVLRVVAQTMKLKIRSVDLLARYGGEEFLLILPATDTAGARVITGRLCESVRKSTFPCLQSSLTLSAGIASFPRHISTSYEELIKQADAALYQAKKSGRDCVSVFHA